MSDKTFERSTVEKAVALITARAEYDGTEPRPWFSIDDVPAELREAFIPALVQSLTSDDRVTIVSLSMMLALPSLPDNAIPSVLNCITHAHIAVRSLAAAVLAMHARHTVNVVLPVLLTMLNHPDFRRLAVSSIVDFSNTGDERTFTLPTSVVPILTEQLTSSGDEQDRRLAAIALNYLNPPAVTAVDALITSLSDQSTIVRRSAAYTLAQIVPAIENKPPNLVSALAVAVTDENPSIAALAATALGRLGPGASSSIPALLECIKKGGAHAYFASIALWKVGCSKQQMIEPLLDISGRGELLATFGACGILSKIGLPDAYIPDVLALLNRIQPPLSELEQPIVSGLLKNTLGSTEDPHRDAFLLNYLTRANHERSRNALKWVAEVWSVSWLANIAIEVIDHQAGRLRKSTTREDLVSGLYVKFAEAVSRDPMFGLNVLQARSLPEVIRSRLGSMLTNLIRQEHQDKRHRISLTDNERSATGKDRPYSKKIVYEKPDDRIGAHIKAKNLPIIDQIVLRDYRREFLNYVNSCTTEREREILFGKLVGDATYQEIAAALGISMSNVRTTFEQVLSRIQAHFSLPPDRKLIMAFAEFFGSDL